MAKMTAEEAAEWGKSLSFEKVWAMFDRVDQKQEEAAEQIREIGRKQVEAEAEAVRRQEEAAEQIREIGRKQAEVEAEAVRRRAEAEAEAVRRQEEAAEQIREIREILREVGRKQAEAGEQLKEVGRKQAANDEELTRLEKTVAETSRNINGVNRSLGKWTEQMVATKLCEKFDDFGYVFTKGAADIKFRENGRTIAEVDVFLENGDFVMPVETKTDLVIEDVNDHIDRIKKIRSYMDIRNDKRKIVGAVAGAIVPDGVRQYAQKRGFYVLTQSGESVAIAKPQDGFNPRKW